MCRVLAYIGEPIQISQLLLKPDNSMVNQTFDPEDHYMIQLAGFGLATWSKGTLSEEYPLIYKGIKPPFYDRNLGSLCERHETNVLLCHVRASGYENLNYESVVNENNCHPFIFPGFRLAMAHNGGVNGFKEIRLDLLNRCKPEIVQYVEGSTDSEVVYALLMSQLDEPTKDLKVDEMIEAIKKMIKVILDVQTKHNCTGLSTLKLFLADSNDILVANIGIGYNRQLDVEGDWEDLKQYPRGTKEFSLSRLKGPVWSLKGQKFSNHNGYRMETSSNGDISSIIIASEPLTEDSTAWSMIPFQTLCFFDHNDGKPKVELKPFDID